MLNKKTHYLQIALNSTLNDAHTILTTIPLDHRIIIEAGTPLIKSEGIKAISFIANYWKTRNLASGLNLSPYIVADLKCMDRAQAEVGIAAQAGASAATVLGQAPPETINSFISSCQQHHLDSYIDMMNIKEPYKIIRQLKQLPTVVLLHRGVDEEAFSDKPLPIHLINKIKGTYNVLIAIAGGDSEREIQSSFFNGANIVVLWKHFYSATQHTNQIATDILTSIR